MSPPILAVHGWGFDASFWTPMLQRLPDFKVERVDMGFRGEPVVPKVARPLIVAHSMGLAWALANIPRPWSGVLAINAFSRFTRSATFVEGVPPRMLERMLARFTAAPAEVTSEFLTRCGIDTPEVSTIRPEPLRKSLIWLTGCDERTAMKMLNCPIQALAGTQDPIVSQAMSIASFPPECLVLADGGGHLLPLTHPDWTASQLRAFAARLRW